MTKLICASGLSQTIKTGTITSFANRAIDWLSTHGWQVAVALLAGFIAYRLLSIAINHSVSLISRDTFLSAEEAKLRAKTLGAVLDALARFVIFFVTILVVLEIISVPIGPILASAGIVGIAIGFGAQSLVKDFISGFFILFENQFSVGDLVQIGNDRGTVEHLSLRTTKLKDFQGNVHIIPNSQINVVINQSRGWSRAIVDIGVPTTEDHMRVMTLIKDTVASVASSGRWKDTLLEDPQVTGIEDFRENTMLFRITAMTASGAQDAIARDIRNGVKTALSGNNIEILTKP
ncbi:MAG: mechanosensitive ion channel family protein [Candidatus Aquicultor sp.]